MKIAYYCQHVLGVGHFHRSLEICRALAKNNRVTMITGGAPLDIPHSPVDFFQLPGLMMDSTFHNLAPCDSSMSLNAVKALRQKVLFSYFKNSNPDVFVTELYPFGRKAFRFELDPVLQAIKNGELSACMNLCSLRDILVERSDRDKFEKRIITTLNSLFDGLLIHGDQRFITLDETFSRVSDISIRSAYTGYVTRNLQISGAPKSQIKIVGKGPQKLIVASIGGGNVGGELLINLAKAVSLLNDHSILLQIFTGPYTPQSVVDKLAALECENIRIDQFTSEFPCWLAAADLSVSMAGYNTCMNVLQAGVPALFYPFAQNQEQRMRVSRFQKQIPCRVIDKDDLQPQRLAGLVWQQLQKRRFHSPVSLDGAEKTAELVSTWYTKFKGNHEI